MSNTDGAIPRLSLTGTPVLYDRRGYPRSVCTLPSFRTGVPPANKGKTLPPEILDPAEVYRLLDALGEKPTGIRDQATIVTMWRGGLRINEALSLELKDIDWNTGRIQILHGKGDKRRLAAIDPKGFAYLERWRDVRAGLGFGRGAFFCVVNGPTKGQQLGSGAGLRTKMKEKAEEVGIDKRCHPHQLRHTFAAFLAESDVPVHHLQRLLGHTSLAVTDRYISHLSPGKVLDAMQLVEWPEAA
jgi:integrase/recombinase XerD